MVDTINFKGVRKQATELDQSFEALKEQIEKQQTEYQKRVQEISQKARFTQFEEEEFAKFLHEPYATLPTKREEEWFIVVPKFIRMNLGWLDHTTHSYNIFKINKFVNWLGDIPDEIKKKFKFGPKLPLKVFDGLVLTGREHQEDAWNRYNRFLSRREGKDKIRIKRGYEFKFIASLIDDGILPFIPTPLEKEDTNTQEPSFVLRDYQKEAWKRFIETGAVGIYWAFSAGKTFFGMYALQKIKGRKLVVVPTRTLVEQWEDRIRKYTDTRHETDVVTYHSFHKVINKEFALVIFDECHHLPANMFSKMSTIKAKYRIGLSGTPYREDGRTDYIFALTGFPVGLSWENLIELGIIEEPDIKLFIISDQREKIKKLRELLVTQKKTIIFCDSISLGNRISKEFEIPHIHGGSTKRIEIIKESDVTVVSRVGDEGLSIPDIERVIEIDFLYGSRRQEGQRMGRLFHGEEKGEHIILMTEKEYEDHNKRLYSIYEKGFRIEVVR